jgi:hypothetical protein
VITQDGGGICAVAVFYCLEIKIIVETMTSKVSIALARGAGGKLLYPLSASH